MVPSAASLTPTPEGLSARERGVLLGSLLFAGDAPQAVRGLAGPWAERCTRARRALDARPEHERRRVVQQLVQQLSWPLPDRLEDLPTDALETLLKAWPGAVAAAIWALLPRSRQGALSRFAGPHPFPPALQHALAAHVLAPLGSAEAVAARTSATRPEPAPKPTVDEPPPRQQGSGR